MEGSDLDRNQHVLTPRWISYPQATAVLDRLQYVFDHPRMHRMPNLVIVGGSHNGKTLVAGRFVKRHPANHDLRAARTTIPVLMVDAPLTPDEGRLYDQLLDGFNAPYRLRDDPRAKRKQLKELLRESATRVLIIDEIHNMIAGYTAKQRLMLNALKDLSNDLRLPIVVVGTVAALRAIQTDPQYANRYERVSLPDWRYDDSFRMFLRQYETTLPLKRASGLADEALARRIHSLSEGLIGEVAKILAEAARMAISDGTEQIDARKLDNLPYYVSPSQQRERVEL
nr:TniB family NTP-binding protein [Deinococcus budaensis]